MKKKSKIRLTKLSISLIKLKMYIDIGLIENYLKSKKKLNVEQING